jgi:hypothetical protein
LPTAWLVEISMATASQIWPLRTPDLPICSRAPPSAFCLGNGDGTFGPPTDFTVGSYPFPIVAADFNRDGKLDLGVANYQTATVSALLGQGDGTFPSKTDFSVGAFPVGLVVADFNGDGKLDFAVGGAPAALSILLGNGDGTFTTKRDFPSLSSMEGFAVGDFNQDGKPDMVLVYFAANSKLSIFLNTTSVDTTPPAITISANPSKLRPADGRWVPVTLSGSIKDTGVGLDPGASTFAVSDEYGQIHPHGHITLQADGNFTVQVLLRASVRSSDKNGREYVITVKAKDKSGNIGSAKTFVRVPLG